ncbi:MAG: hypothetical protein M3Q18_11685 [Actinomycetota bacterium]|nr:hypothetical protein [Actinomycetota bacterium]
MMRTSSASPTERQVIERDDLLVLFDPAELPVPPSGRIPCTVSAPTIDRLSNALLHLAVKPQRFPAGSVLPVLRSPCRSRRRHLSAGAERQTGVGGTAVGVAFSGIALGIATIIG